MQDVLLVGLGGFCGSVCRYALSGLAQRVSHSISWPWGTLVVNVLGCFLIGLASHLAIERGIVSTHNRSLLIVGILGGLTTFSTFANETYNLLHDREMGLALLNLSAELLLGLGGVWFGHVAARLMWR